jgi:uncharacterized protein YacL
MSLFKKEKQFVFDTSMFIDGRVVPMLKHHLMGGKLVVPAFVIRELQALADSKNFIKVKKSQRGYQALADFKALAIQLGYKIDFPEREYVGLSAVDDKLVAYCMAEKGVLVTLDEPLTKLAVIRGVAVLNLDQLLLDVKFNIRPGDQFMLEITEPGHEEGQGVGYRDGDGLMVVVQNCVKVLGRNFLNKKVTVIVRRMTRITTRPIIFADVI